MSPIDEARRAWILAFADDELAMGHRHSEWLGVAPFLEEDLAYASIAQDELGHARALYGLLTDDVDGLAFGRQPHEFRSAHLVELPCRSWEEALARHYLYDTAETVRWTAAARSADAGIAGVAAKALQEEAYHLRHAEPLVRRMLMGTEESRDRVLGALRRLYPYARAVFEATEGEAELVAAGISDTPAAELEQRWRAGIAETLATVDASLDWDAPPAGAGGRRGERSEHFGEMFATMTAVLAIDRGASW